MKIYYYSSKHQVNKKISFFLNIEHLFLNIEQIARKIMEKR